MFTKSKRTLVAKEIRNLTKQEMWCYGTSGAVVRLVPQAFDMNVLKNGPEKDTFYIVEERNKPALLDKNILFNNAFAIPVSTGKGAGGEDLYRFTNYLGNTDIVPVTDNEYSPGDIIIDGKFNGIRHWRQ